MEAQRHASPSTVPTDLTKEYVLSRWTEERAGLLEKLWVAGFSCAQIAREINRLHPGAGFSRNAIIGKVTRLKLGGREKPAAPRLVVRRPAPRPRVVSRTKLAGNGMALVEAVALPPLAPLRAKAFAPLPDSTPRPWMERPADACMWPIDTAEGVASCCLPRSSATYCQTHHRMAVAPAKPRTDAQKAARRQRRAA